MVRSETRIEIVGAQNGMEREAGPSTKTGQIVWLLTLCAIAMAVLSAPQWMAAQAKRTNLPYITIDNPQFVSASQATFLSPNDLLIGVTDGKTAKAYPAAILAQHGVVQDRMGDGPIAVTW